MGTRPLRSGRVGEPDAGDRDCAAGAAPIETLQTGRLLEQGQGLELRRGRGQRDERIPRDGPSTIARLPSGEPLAKGPSIPVLAVSIVAGISKTD